MHRPLGVIRGIDFGTIFCRIFLFVLFLFLLLSFQLPPEWLRVGGAIAIIWGVFHLIRKEAWRTAKVPISHSLAFVLSGFLCFAVAPMEAWGQRAMLSKAKATTALSSLVSIESALKAFQAEYGALPSVPGELSTAGPAGVKLLGILSGLENDSGPHQNPKNIKFLNLKEGKPGRGYGLMHSSEDGSIQAFYDPWNHPLMIELKSDTASTLRFNYRSQSVELPDKIVAAYSPGPDGQAGTADDIKSW